MLLLSLRTVLDGVECNIFFSFISRFAVSNAEHWKNHSTCVFSGRTCRSLFVRVHGVYHYLLLLLFTFYCCHYYFALWINLREQWLALAFHYVNVSCMRTGRLKVGLRVCRKLQQQNLNMRLLHSLSLHCFRTSLHKRPNDAKETRNDIRLLLMRHTLVARGDRQAKTMCESSTKKTFRSSQCDLLLWRISDSMSVVRTYEIFLTELRLSFQIETDKNGQRTTTHWKKEQHEYGSATGYRAERKHQKR